MQEFLADFQVAINSRQPVSDKDSVISTFHWTYFGNEDSSRLSEALGPMTKAGLGQTPGFLSLSPAFPLLRFAPLLIE